MVLVVLLYWLSTEGNRFAPKPIRAIDDTGINKHRNDDFDSSKKNKKLNLAKNC